MKKSYVLVMIVLSSIYCVAAMGSDRQLLQQEGTRKYGALQITDKTQSQKSIDYFAQLPCEIQYKIAGNMLYIDGLCEESAKKSFNNPLPILCAVKLYHEYKNSFDELQQRYSAESPLTIGNRELSAFDLWRLSPPKRDRLISMLKESIFKRIEGRDNTFDEEELDEIVHILSDDLLKGLEVGVFRERSCFHKHYRKILGGVLMSMGGIFVVGGVVGHMPALWSIGSVLMLAGPIGYFRSTHRPSIDIKRVDIKIKAEEV